MQLWLHDADAQILCSLKWPDPDGAATVLCNHGAGRCGRLIWPEPSHRGGLISRDDGFGGRRLVAQ